jgi:L-lactate dehydrogenase (cytochrome)
MASGRLNRILDLDDFERAVQTRLPRAVYGYVAHGSETETSLRSNRAIFDEWRLLTRVLVGVLRLQLGDRAVEPPLRGHVWNRSDGRQCAGRIRRA